MSYSRKICLQQEELVQLSKQLQNIFETNQLPTNNIYIGGFSSGGNVALLISDFMIAEKASTIPKGVFIVDSPIDLEGLYQTAKKNVERNFSNSILEESTWLLKVLTNEFGAPKDSISNYEAYSIFTSKTNNIDNIKNLKNTKIRLYTEPDTLWWKKTTMAKYEEMNAYYIETLSKTLQLKGFKATEYIITKNKGYRSNGEKSPHSWSIIDTKDLINWMLLKEHP